VNAAAALTRRAWTASGVATQRARSFGPADLTQAMEQRWLHGHTARQVTAQQRESWPEMFKIHKRL